MFSVSRTIFGRDDVVIKKPSLKKMPNVIFLKYFDISEHLAVDARLVQTFEKIQSVSKRVF
jgi:hypothetical protein